METEQLCQFVDGVIEGAYQAKCFRKENVQEVLIAGNMIKIKMQEADTLKVENTARSITIENLENQIALLKKKFNVSDADIESLKNENVINEIELHAIEEISNHVPKSEKVKPLQ